jgi:hypothetical protein
MSSLLYPPGYLSRSHYPRFRAVLKAYPDRPQDPVFEAQEPFGETFTAVRPPFPPPRRNTPRARTVRLCGRSWPFRWTALVPIWCQAGLGMGGDQTDLARATWLSHSYHLASSRDAISLSLRASDLVGFRRQQGIPSICSIGASLQISKGPHQRNSTGGLRLIGRHTVELGRPAQVQPHGQGIGHWGLNLQTIAPPVDSIGSG